MTELTSDAFSFRFLISVDTSGTKVMEETAKAMGLSEASTAKVREYFKKAYETMKEKGDYQTKTEEEKKKFMEESVTAIQAEVDEAEKELVAKVVNAAYVSSICILYLRQYKESSEYVLRK